MTAKILIIPIILSIFFLLGNHKVLEITDPIQAITETKAKTICFLLIHLNAFKAYPEKDFVVLAVK